MNKERRKAIEQISERLVALKDEINSIAEGIECQRDEEQEAYDNLPESLQNGDRGSAMQEAIEALDAAAGGIGSLDVDELIGYLETACA